MENEREGLGYEAKGVSRPKDRPNLCLKNSSIAGVEGKGMVAFACHFATRLPGLGTAQLPTGKATRSLVVGRCRP